VRGPVASIVAEQNDAFRRRRRAAAAELHWRLAMSQNSNDQDGRAVIESEAPEKTTHFQNAHRSRTGLNFSLCWSGKPLLDISIRTIRPRAARLSRVLFFHGKGARASTP
jgi:hypothetical protein